MGATAQLKKFFAAFAGGQELSGVWKTDAYIRATAAMSGYERSPTQGGIFLESFRELSGAVDAFNASRPPERQFRIMLHQDVASKLADAVVAPDRALFDFSRIEGVGLERNGRVYQGNYNNDPRGASGFTFGNKGVENTFTCGRDKSDFEKFATRLLNPPYPYPGVSNIPVSV